MKINAGWVMLVCALLGACATTPESDNIPKMSDVLGEQTGQNGRACVRKSDIRSFGYEDRVLTINARGGYYVATTVMRCHRLDGGSIAAFDGPHGEVCGGGSSSAAGCPIATVFEFKNRSDAFQALDAARAVVDAAAKAAE